MASNRLVKDMSRLIMDEKKHFGITDATNIADKAMNNFSADMTFNAEYLLSALESMKHLNEGSLKDVQLLIPKEPFPLLINNGIQCIMISPITTKGENNARRD